MYILDAANYESGITRLAFGVAIKIAEK